MTSDVENKPMLHGPYNFLMEHEPECPFCRQRLLPVTTIFNQGTAFCQACYDVLGPVHVSQIIATQHDDTTRAFWANARGLHFFTPHGFIPIKTAAHLMPWLLREESDKPPLPEPDEQTAARRTAITPPSPR